MLKITKSKDTTKILLTRGDSAYITLTINTENGTYPLQEEDKVRVQVRDVPNTGELIFEGNIEIQNDEIIWHIIPSQTSDLEVKTYYWDAQLETANGDIFTFIPSSPFKLLDEVTMPNE